MNEKGQLKRAKTASRILEIVQPSILCIFGQPNSKFTTFDILYDVFL